MSPQHARIGSALLTSSFLIILLSSCTHNPENLDDLEPVCFDTQVLPILKTSCGIAGCHDGSEKDFLASDYNSVMGAVKPGDPRNSKLYKIITAINSDDMMPPDRPLTRLQRNIIQVWIAQGAHEIKCKTDTSGNVIDEICFVQDILPMMLSSCGVTGCHDAITQEEGHVFTDYTSIVSHGIEPFDPFNSEIYEVITESGDDRMPPEPRAALTSSQIDAMRQWIEDGAVNSDCPGNVCDSAGIMSFITHVNPVFNTNCVGCHNSVTANGGVNLSGYNQVLTYAQTLQNGTPLLLGVMKRATGFVPMPPSFTLDECSVTKVEKWISQGAQNN